MKTIEEQMEELQKRIIKDIKENEKHSAEDGLNYTAQKQLNCPYCCGMTLADYHRQLEEDGLYDYGYIEKVKYCGVCGRKLGGD